MERSKIALRLIFAIMLMDVVGITILYPVTPYIVARYSTDAIYVTLMTVLYAAGQFFAAPLMGKLGDRYGRRPVLLISVFGSAIGYLMFGLGGALWVLLLSRLIDGITAGNMSTASAYIADVSKPEERAQNFALIGIAWGIGLIVGPALGSLFSRISLEAPAFAAAAFALLNVALGYFFLPESLPRDQRTTQPLSLNDLNPFVSIGHIARKPGLGGVLLALCLFNFAFNGINNTQTLFIIQKFSAQPDQIGALLTAIGVAIVIVQFTLIQPVVSRFGDRAVAIASLLVQALAGVLIFFAPALALVYALTVLNSAASSFTFPTLTTLTANRVSPSEQGVLMGVTTALNSIMNIFGPLWAGLVYDNVVRGAPHWMGALILAAAAFILMRMREPVTVG